MRYETIKQNCAAEVRRMILSNRDDRANMYAVFHALSLPTMHAGECLMHFADAAAQRVMEWDVRAAGRLRDLFPLCFPPSLRKGPLRAYMADTEDCDWMVERA